MQRRSLIALLGASALPLQQGAAGVLAIPAPLGLDLTRPVDNLTAWMKMRGSLEGQDVYFWFTGGLDVAIPGEPVRPFVTVESLSRCRCRPVP